MIKIIFWVFVTSGLNTSFWLDQHYFLHPGSLFSLSCLSPASSNQAWPATIWHFNPPQRSFLLQLRTVLYGQSYPCPASFQEKWKVWLGPAGSIQHTVPPRPIILQAGGPFLTNPSCLWPALLWAVIGMWIAVCRDDNKSANRGQACVFQPAANPSWHGLKDNRCPHLRRQIKMTS